MDMRKDRVKRLNPELWAEGSLSPRAWCHLASKCKVQLDATAWKLQQAHSQNIHDSWVPPVICDVTQQAIHEMAAMITAGRLILSGPTAEDEKDESLLG